MRRRKEQGRGEGRQSREGGPGLDDEEDLLLGVRVGSGRDDLLGHADLEVASFHHFFDLSTRHDG
jgi:hypothetical protein